MHSTCIYSFKDELNRQRQEEKMKKLQELELKRQQSALLKEQVCEHFDWSALCATSILIGLLNYNWLFFNRLRSVFIGSSKLELKRQPTVYLS